MAQKINPKIAILGAGLAGISLGYFLKQLGIPCQIFEKEHQIGGLCRSTKINDFTFDCCGHLLHFRHRHSLSLIQNILRHNLIQHKRNAWIHSFQRFTRYPFQVNLHGLPHNILKKSLVDFITANTDGVKPLPHNFLEWCYRNFGEGITEHFMHPYNKKFWTVAPQKLCYEWVDKFVVVPTLRQVIEGTVEENRRNLGYHSFFWYPRSGGIEELIKGFSSHIHHIHTGYEVFQINPIAREIYFKNGKVTKYDLLISTIPLPQLSKILTTVPRGVAGDFKKLRWVSIYNINLGVRQKVKPDWHWIYFPEKEYRFFRVGFSHNFSSSVVPPGRSALYVEVSYSKEKPLDKKTILLQVIDDLIKVNILPSKSSIEASVINDVKYAYPLYDLNWRTARTNILHSLHGYKIFPIGRFGGWQYMSMEDVMLEAQSLAEMISHNGIYQKS